MSDTAYICPQCGPDANGGEVHALTHHRLPPCDVEDARELVRLQSELSAARAELATAREHEAAALSGQRQLLAKYDGALRQLEEARKCLRECIANFGELCAGGVADAKWRKAAGMDT